MAKRKKPVSIFNLPKEEVMKASSEIITNTNKENSVSETSIEKKEQLKPKATKTKKKTTQSKVKTLKALEKDQSNLKRKFLYVDEIHHQKAKVNAAIRGMKLQDYIAWLIENDKS